MKKIGVLILLAWTTACTLSGDRQADAILKMANTSTTTLQNKTSDEVQEILGKPTFIRTEAPHQTWTYKVPGCALFLFFDEAGKCCYTESKGSCSTDVARRMMAQKSS